jgi:arylformamidase
MPFSRFWDISKTLKNEMVVWPEDTPFNRSVRKSTRGGRTWSNSEMTLGCHTGTHLDAPRHLFEHGGDINSIALSTLIGTCRVVEINESLILADQITALAPAWGERILFKTANSEILKDETFHKDYVSFDGGAALALVESQVVLVGIDGPSVDPYKSDTHPAHTVFCETGIAVVENLDLADVEPGPYTLICLPLKLEGADGSPVRAILAR